MEQNMQEVSKTQETKDLIWFGQGQILGELENADPAKAESDPAFMRKTALNLTVSLKEFIDEQAKESGNEEGANEVFISAVQLLGRKVNADYQKVINSPIQAIKHVFNQAILSIDLIDEMFTKKESEVTEE